jgi:hypothetical protein
MAIFLYFEFILVWLSSSGLSIFSSDYKSFSSKSISFEGFPLVLLNFLVDDADYILRASSWSILSDAFYFINGVFGPSLAPLLY